MRVVLQISGDTRHRRRRRRLPLGFLVSLLFFCLASVVDFVCFFFPFKSLPRRRTTTTTTTTKISGFQTKKDVENNTRPRGQNRGHFGPEIKEKKKNKMADRNETARDNKRKPTRSGAPAKGQAPRANLSYPQLPFVWPLFQGPAQLRAAVCRVFTEFSHRPKLLCRPPRTVGPGFIIVILGFTGFYWVLLGFTGFYCGWMRR